MALGLGFKEGSDYRALLEIQIFGMKCKASGGFLGSESKFIVPLARPSGAMLCIVMKLASDPNNPPRNAATRPKNEFIEVPYSVSIKLRSLSDREGCLSLRRALASI